MAFYSALLNDDVNTNYFENEEQATAMAVALYNGETFEGVSRFCNHAHQLDHPHNVGNMFLASKGGNTFISAVFEKEMKREMADGTLKEPKVFRSERTQRIFDELYRELVNDTKKKDVIIANQAQMINDLKKELEALKEKERKLKEILG